MQTHKQRTRSYDHVSVSYTHLDVYKRQVLAPEGGPVYASSAAIQRSTQNWHGPGESDCLIKTKHCDRPPTGVDAM